MRNHQPTPMLPPDDPERGDVPGWVLVTLMTAGMVTVIWGVAQSSLLEVFSHAISSVTAP